MQRAPLHVLVLYDLPELTPGHADAESLMNNKDRPTERDVCRSIKKLGFKLSVFGVFDEISEISEVVKRLKPDVLFNLCETFHGNRKHEGHVAGILELLQVSVTGSTADALQICKDKAITKKIAGYDGILIPRFQLIRRGEVFCDDKIRYPAIVKPLNREASEGIAKASIVHDAKSCQDRITFIHDKLTSDVIVEEFIHGRELYVGVIEGPDGARALPPRELFMHELKSDQAMVATYQAKWNDEYRRRWGIETAKPRSLSETTAKQLEAGSIKIFQTLNMSGYARIDWRVSETGDAVFLEANPNPALAMDDDFAKAAKMAGIGYQELIMAIIHSAINRKNLVPYKVKTVLALA